MTFRAAGLSTLVLSALALGGLAPAAGAAAAPPLGVDLLTLSTTTATIRTVCPDDPPQTVVLYTVDGVLGSTPISCTRRPQVVRVPLSTPLPAGTRLDVTVLVSGDSGEITATFPDVRVHP